MGELLDSFFTLVSLSQSYSLHTPFFSNRNKLFLYTNITKIDSFGFGLEFFISNYRLKISKLRCVIEAWLRVEGNHNFSKFAREYTNSTSHVTLYYARGLLLYYAKEGTWQLYAIKTIIIKYHHLNQVWEPIWTGGHEEFLGINWIKYGVQNGRCYFVLFAITC